MVFVCFKHRNQLCPLDYIPVIVFSFKFEDVAEKIRNAIEADMRQKALQEYISELRAKALIEYFF
jgi:hypothetical protein